jgi:hypothetical protein
MKKIKQFHSFFYKPLVLIIFTFIVFSPLLYLNIRHDHDWGGDFAHYLSQAENCTQFRPMDETGYLYNEAYTILASKVPPGFPMILAPFVKLYGNQTTPYNYLLSFFLIACGIFTVFLLKKLVGIFPAIFMSTVIYYNPYFITFKSEILADLPFALYFLVFVFLTFEKTTNSIRFWVCIGLLVGFATATKSIGYVLFLALLIHSLQLFITEWIKSKKIKNAILHIKPIFISILSGIAFTVILNILFFHKISVSTGYSNTFNLVDSLYKTFSDNALYYSEMIRLFFINYNVSWFSTLFGSAVLTFFLTGLIISFNKRPKLIDWVTSLFFAVLFVYPYQSSGFRLLIPVAPLFIYYCSITLIQLRIGRKGMVFVMLFSTLMLLHYSYQIRQIQNSVETIQEGPYSPHVVTAFEKIKELTTTEDIIVFTKPRVLFHYTNRKSMMHKPGSSISEMENQYSIHNPNFFLLYSGLNDASLELYINENSENIKLIWQNNFFKLYKKVFHL